MIGWVFMNIHSFVIIFEAIILFKISAILLVIIIVYELFKINFYYKSKLESRNANIIILLTILYKIIIIPFKNLLKLKNSYLNILLQDQYKYNI